MDRTNRRDAYRHDFTLLERLPVKLASLDCAAILTGTIVNLSLGGMTVVLDLAWHEPESGDQLIAQFSLTTGKPHQRIDCSVIHVRRQGERPLVGLQFLPMEDAAKERARDKALWKFLLTEQRRRLRFLEPKGPGLP